MTKKHTSVGYGVYLTFIFIIIGYFRNWLFVLNSCAMCVGSNGVMMASILLPPRAGDLGVDKHTAAMLLSILGGCDFVGRILGGCFSDLG